MIAGKFDPSLFFRRADNVALRVPASELFGFAKRSLDLPGQWAALLVNTTGERTIVKSGGVIESGDIDGVLFVRTTPIEILIQEDVTSKDGFSCQATVRLKVCLLLDRSDLVSFENEVLGSHRVVQVERLTRYMTPDVRDGLLSVARARDASQLIGAVDAHAVESAMIDALKEPCFRAGLTLEGPPSVTVRSESFRHVSNQRQQVATQRALHDSKRELQQALQQAQSKHLDHLSDLLTRLKTLADDSPETDLPQLIKTFSDSQRGEIYQALMTGESGTTKTRWIVIAAGDELLFFDPQHVDRPARRFEVSGSVGPVRSVQSVRQPDGSIVLWLGAATGVYRWPIDASCPDLTLSVQPTPDLRGGFNAVVASGNHLYATHSELGICAWSLSDPNSSTNLFGNLTQKARAVRAVRACDGHLYAAIDHRVIRWPVGELPSEPDLIFKGSVSVITALCPIAQSLYAGTADGDVLFWSPGGEKCPRRLHTGTGRSCESVWITRTHGLERLIFTDTSLHVYAQVIGDSFVCRYEAGGQTLRRVNVTDDMLVATNDLRDRLLLWNPANPSAPSATILVASQTGRSVQDICLIASD